MSVLMSLGDNMTDITGRKDSPKPPSAPSGLGHGYDVEIMDDMVKQEEAQAKISPSEPWPEMTKHGVAEAYLQVKAMNDPLTADVKWPGQKPNALKHSEYMVERKRLEMEKAEVAFREARIAFEKLRFNCEQRKAVRLDLIRQQASDILEGYDPHDLQLAGTDSAPAAVEEVEGGFWVEARVWVAK
jgi:hypothetical protein